MFWYTKSTRCVEYFGDNNITLHQFTTELIVPDSLIPAYQDIS